MADSNITKHALAEALQGLMTELPFEKINVAQICERCNMNRKSFYYHFKDKYDLVNWIFDTEFIALLKQEGFGSNYREHWAFVEKTCQYFYEKHGFYCKALQIKGQNSFRDHFREYIRPLMADRICSLFGRHGVDEFSVDFFTDAVICAMERWLLTKECMPPEQFVGKLKRITEECSQSICREMSQAEQEPS